MPDEQAKVVKEIPRDAETIELFKSLPEPGLYRRGRDKPDLGSWSLGPGR